MKNLLFLAAGFFLIYFTSYAQVTHTFQRGYGTAYDDEGISLCEDNNFGYVVAGYTKGYTAGQNMDIYLVHFNSNGNVTWSNYHDDGLNEIGTSILRYNSGDYYVMSNKGVMFSNILGNTHILLSKVSANGNFLWTKTFNTSSTVTQYGNEMMLLPDGNLVICGIDMDNVGGSIDSTGLIMIIDTSGNIINSNKYTINNGTNFTDMIITQDNKLALSGQATNGATKYILLIKSDFSGDTLWTKSYPFTTNYQNVSCLLQIPNGNILIGGVERTNWGNSFLHGVDSTGDSVLFHKVNHMIADEMFAMKYSTSFQMIYAAEGYYNFQTYFGFLYSDTLGNMSNSIQPFFYIPSYWWDYMYMVSPAKEILVYDDPITYYPYITLTGMTKFSAHGGYDVAITHSKDDFVHNANNWTDISAKTSTTICPGDSVLITVDSNYYSTSHWINAMSNGSINLSVYNDSIWVTDSGYYYIVGMDQDSSIIISNEVEIVMIDTVAPVITHTGNLGFCYASGQTLNLSIIMRPNSHYQWYKDGNPLLGDSNSTIHVILSGIYTCSRTNVCGTFYSNPVTVNAQVFQPIFSTLSLTGTFSTWCTNNIPVVLHVQVSSGTGYTYNWYLNNQFFASSNTNYQTIQQPGTYFVIISNNCGSHTSNNIYPFSQPLPSISGNNTICSGTDSTLLHSTINISFNSIQWYINNNPIQGATSATHMASQDGSYKFSIMTNQCFNSPIFSSSFTLSIGLVTLPSISISCLDTLICFNEFTYLNLFTAASSKYIRRNGLPYLTTSSGSAQISQGGVYDVFVMNACDTNYSNSITIFQFPSINLNLGNDTLLCNSQSLLLDAGPGYANYNWHSGDTLQTFLAVTTLITDTQRCIVNVTDSDNCHTEDTINIFFDVCSEINSILNNNEFRIFPNPSTGKVSILMNDNFHFQKAEFQIYNLLGEKVFSLFVNNKDELTNINIQILSNGIYNCRLILNEADLVVGKLAIVH